VSSAPVPVAADWLAAYPPPRSLTLDPEALLLYERAYYIGAQSEQNDPAVSFTTLAVALLVCADETSRWFAENGPRLDVVLAGTRITQQMLDQAAPRHGQPPDSELHLSSDGQLLTSSSRAVLESAENWAQLVGGSDIGVRHVVAAYLINPPPYHRDLLQKWQIKENESRARFYDWVSARFTWEQWSDTKNRAAPAQSRVAFEQTPFKGGSLVWPGNDLALAVLDDAARWHAQTGDTWLSYSTLLIALVQSAADQTRDQIQPILNAVRKSQAMYDHEFNRKIGDVPARQTAHTPFAELDLSPRVLNTLETARQLATAGRTVDAGTEIKASPLHLAGALASVRVDGAEQLARFGIDVLTLRPALLDHATSRGEPLEVWSEMLGQEEMLLTGRPVNLNSDEPEAVIRLDEPWTSDPLEIRPDVEAFGALLATRDLEPPLSIGLFGPWGSGKTTFLKRLRRAVQRHADETGRNGSSSWPYVRNVVHVEFNAWHFSEGALISSLVDATIREIKAFVNDETALSPKGWLGKKLDELESRKRQVAAATDLHTAAVNAVAATQEELGKQQKSAAEHAASLGEAIRGVWTATVAAFKDDNVVKSSGVLDAVGSGVQDLQELRQRVESIRGRPGRMLADLGWGHSILFGLLVLVVPPLATVLVQKLTHTTDFGSFLTSVTAMLTLVGLWVKTASGAVNKADKALAAVVARYQQQIESDDGVKKAKASLKQAEDQVQTTATSLQRLREELARAEADVANASIPAQTLQLVSSRIEDRAYAKELTTLSLARADLERLSDLLRDKPTDSTGADNGLRAIDRVILYVDDLDRCKPEDVVRVLQLVHMLLAFELFAVVVAVDARWVEQALKQSYPWLSRSLGAPAIAAGLAGPAQAAVEPFGHVTPEDYLEKIFQIAFWLEPMTAVRAAKYLRSLVRTGRGTPPPGAPDAAANFISTTELNYMLALAAYVGSSPRRVKRLVNAYRLIKARLSDTQLNAFITDRRSGRIQSGPYQIVIGLLVIGTGTQSAASAILGDLSELNPQGKYAEVVARFKEKNEPDWTAAAQVLETIRRSQNAADVSELRGWARKVGRFLLHGPKA
jgi:KAP-like P-loop domain-containing protein